MDLCFEGSARISLDRDVAVVRVQGTTCADQMETLGRCLGLCAREPLVRSVCLVIDSRGGYSFGLPDVEPVIAATAKAIAAKGGAMAVHIEGMGASNGYQLACLAQRASGCTITASPAAIVGSIGALIALSGSQKMAQMSGQEVEVISSGPLKGAGVYGTGITEEQRAQARMLVDSAFADFRQTVMQARKLSDAQMQAVTTGGVWPAAQALKLGLVDEVITLPEVVSRLAALPRPGDVPAPSPTGLSPAGNPTDTPDTPDPEDPEDTPMSSTSTPAPTGNATPTGSATPSTGNTPAPVPATAAQLKAEFGADPAFCFAQIEAGATLEQARAAFAAKSSATIGELTGKVAELSAKVEELTKRRTGGVPVSSTVTATGDNADVQGSRTAEEFVAAAKAMAEAQKIRPLAAVARLAKDPAHEAGYAAYRKTVMNLAD